MKRALLFGGVPVVAGILLIVLWSSASRQASRGADWMQVIATIEKATVEPGVVRLAYRYELGGVEHRNPDGQIRVRDAAAASSVTERYAQGRQVLAYANPAAPSESFMERSAQPSSWNLIAGVVLLIAGIPVGVYFLREKPPEPAKPVHTPSRPMSRLKPPPSIPRK